MAQPRKSFEEIVASRRATLSFDGTPVAPEDILTILEAGRAAPSSYNLQPWRFFVVQSAAQKTRVRDASYNQAKIEEAPVVIVACGDSDGWRNGDLEQVLTQGRESGMPASYAAMLESQVPAFLSNIPDMTAWLNRQVMIAVTYMMLMAESLGYDTAPMEGFEEDKLKEVLRLPLRLNVVCLLAIGHRKGKEKFNGRRFLLDRIVFGEEFPKPFRG